MHQSINQSINTTKNKIWHFQVMRESQVNNCTTCHQEHVYIHMDSVIVRFALCVLCLTRQNSKEQT